jgi:hypothetical protein
MRIGVDVDAVGGKLLRGKRSNIYQRSWRQITNFNLRYSYYVMSQREIS